MSTKEILDKIDEEIKKQDDELFDGIRPEMRKTLCEKLLNLQREARIMGMDIKTISLNVSWLEEYKTPPEKLLGINLTT